MEKKIANFISVIAHPVIIPTYFFIAIFNINTYISLIIPYNTKLFLLGIVFLSTFLLPLLLTFIFIKKGFIKSLQMETREERTYPFIFTSICYYFTYYFFRQVNLPREYYMFLLGGLFLILIIIIINFFWKISIHSVSIGGVVGAFIGLSIQTNIYVLHLIFLSIFISGLVGYSRLKLNAHKPAQVYVGFFTGFLVMFLFFVL